MTVWSGAVRGTEDVGCIVIKQTSRLFENFVRFLISDTRGFVSAHYKLA
jgi:hypothetical protein